MTLTGEAKEAVLNMEINELKDNNGNTRCCACIQIIKQC